MKIILKFLNFSIYISKVIPKAYSDGNLIERCQYDIEMEIWASILRPFLKE